MSNLLEKYAGRRGEIYSFSRLVVVKALSRQRRFELGEYGLLTNHHSRATIYVKMLTRGQVISIGGFARSNPGELADEVQKMSKQLSTLA